MLIPERLDSLVKSRDSVIRVSMGDAAPRNYHIATQRATNTVTVFME